MDLKAKINNQTNTRKTMKPYLTIFLFLTIAYMPTANAQIPGTQNFWAEAEAATTGSFPEGMSITNADQIKYVASVYDTDYDPAPDPLPAATLATFGDGGTDKAIDIQGVIGTAGSGDEITVTLNYTATAVGNYPALSETVTVPSELIEGGGAPIDLTLSYPAGTTVAGDGTITATITAASTLNVKQLDLYGLGLNDTTIGYPLASFSISTDNSDGEGTVDLRIFTAIPDIKFGNGTHDFLYGVVVSPDTGRIWLNNNLGADYANINHASFDIIQQATSPGDAAAFGNYFQFGRASDGHEFRDGPTSSARPNNISPGTNIFYVSSTTQRDWTTGDSTKNDRVAAWTDGGVNDICPEGFSVPTRNEIIAETANASTNPVSNNVDLLSNFLMLPSPGIRLHSSPTTISNEGNWGYYSTRTKTSVNHITALFRSDYANISYSDLVSGHSVRCVKDL